MSQLRLALHRLVTAPGLTFPANTYNFCGAWIRLAHTKLNILKWRALFGSSPKKDIIDKLEFGFPIGIDPEQEISNVA